MNPSPSGIGKIPKAFEDRIIDNVSIADIEHVGLGRIFKVIQDALEDYGDNPEDMFVSIKRVPFICMQITSIHEKMGEQAKSIDRLIGSIQTNWDRSQEQNKRFITHDSLNSFREVYIIEQTSMKRAIYGCTAAVFLALIANVVTRFASF